MVDVSEKHSEEGLILWIECLRDGTPDAGNIIAAALANAELEGMKRGYLAGFNESGEGWNAEYPFQDQGMSPEGNAEWVESRDRFLTEAVTD